MKYLRYTGSFVSRAGHVWKVDITQEAESEFPHIGSLDFDADEPLSIEWRHADKEQVVCGSSATLKIVSPFDRAYEDLYSIETGRVSLDVYKDNILYWSGTMDTEFYEEPYEQLSGYLVSLTFSDFGILDRLKYDLAGMHTAREVIEYAVLKSEILHSEIDTSMISSSLEDGTMLGNGALSVRSDNFIDEDGEQSTLKEAVEGMLQPLGIKMIQREGKIYLFDINGLYAADQRAIEWDGDSQTMGVDKVYNNVKVTFSPYSAPVLNSQDVGYPGKYGIDKVNLRSDAPVAPAEYGEYYSYYPDYSDSHSQEGRWDYNLVDFTLFIHPNSCKGLSSIGRFCKSFHILPVTGSAEECSGVAYSFKTGGHGSLSTGWPEWKVNPVIPKAWTSGGGSEILTSTRSFIPKLSSADAKKYYVRVMEEILVDARYNPFSGAAEGNEEDNDNALKVSSAFVFIPAKITLYDASGNALYHYKNRDTAFSFSKGHLGYSRGSWVAGADKGGDCWLEYYSTDDLKDDTGIRGWKGNRHCIGRPDGRGGRDKADIYDSFKKMPEGEYLPYPPVAGYIEVQIQSGVIGCDYDTKIDANGLDGVTKWEDAGMYSKLRWCLYKAPEVSVVNNNLVFDESESDDIEYSGYINKAAKEELSIDTICGTSHLTCPTARGLLYVTATGEPLQKLSRAGKIDSPEKLLIGTLYSQYGGRHTTLSGEAVIHGGLHAYSEQNQGNKVFMLVEDVQNVITDCTDATYCEISQDEYEIIEEV